MLQKLKNLTAAVAIMALTATSTNAQLKVPAPSPLQTIKAGFCFI